MQKIYKILSVLFICCLFFTGCGKINTADISSDSPKVTQNNSQESSPQEENAKQKESSEETPVVPEPTEGSLTVEEGYADVRHEISILGLKEYKKLKGESYTDKPKKGKKYLVLFLKIRNRRDEDEYFNVNYLTAKLDGHKVQNTYLVNQPEGYPTIFDHIEANTTAGGFIVWEVPSKWKNLEINYTGWKDSDGLTLSANLNKENLKEPQKYDEAVFH